MSHLKDFASLCLDSNSDIVAHGRGRNIIPPSERQSLWIAYLEKFKDPIIIVLLVVFLFSVGLSLYEILVMGHGWSMMLEPVGVFLALLLATGVGFIFEVKAGREFDILNKVKDSRPVKVLRRRDGSTRPQMELVAKQDVVLGDIVVLENGDEVPADGVLLRATSLRVDESDFTGEMYANKSVDEAEFDSEATYPSNFLLRGSTVIEGRATMQVKAIGVDTEEGRGVAQSSEGSDVKTPLNQQLGELGGWISKAGFIIASLIIIGRMLYFALTGGFSGDITWVEIMEFLLSSVMLAVTLVVVAVPEGLPMSITVSLALSMRRMLKEKSLVRKLHACETMGATTVICSDKTGTLTQNRMSVVGLELVDDADTDTFERGVAINTTAELSIDNGRVQPIGNPTEGALLLWLDKQGKNYASIREEYNVVSQEPFSTETKYMATVAKHIESGLTYRFVKGAPEIVMAMCSDTLPSDMRMKFNDILLGYQSRAMRTLAFAVQTVDDDGQCQPLRFMGAVGIADPIREDVAEAIDVCMKEAGVRVIIVTGDTSVTAAEIGRQIGLITADDDSSAIITGPEFAAMDDDSARELLRDRRLKIIARARPDDKARLVTLLQANNEVVAVTGDGTNDAPALSKAQVGLSMGDGTSRAKEASDITIIDNSFASINKAIMWGRSLYLNIRRFIIFQMTINLSACMIVLLGAFIGLDSPLTVTQMLWVNLIMDTFAAMALSSLPPDESVMRSKPRNPNSHIIDRAMLYRIVLVGVAFFVLLAGLWQLLYHTDISSVRELFSGESIRLFVTGIFSGHGDKLHLSGYEMGVFFSIFVMLQFWNLFNARYFRTGRSLLGDIIATMRNPKDAGKLFSKEFLLIVVVILVGQILIVNYADRLFSVAPLPAADWVWIMILTSPVLILPDMIRMLKR